MVRAEKNMYQQLRRLARPELEQATRRRCATQRLAYNRAWYARNLDHCHAQAVIYRKRHQPARTAAESKRRALMQCEGNSDLIRGIYRQAAILRSQGQDVHVDHIIPLALGGLHSHDNLQIIPSLDNLRKGCR